MIRTEDDRLAINAIEAVLNPPNRLYTMRESIRMGRVDSARVVEALGWFDHHSVYKRMRLAIVDTIFSREETSSG